LIRRKRRMRNAIFVDSAKDLIVDEILMRYASGTSALRQDLHDFSRQPACFLGLVLLVCKDSLVRLIELVLVDRWWRRFLTFLLLRTNLSQYDRDKKRTDHPDQTPFAKPHCFRPPVVRSQHYNPHKTKG